MEELECIKIQLPGMDLRITAYTWKIDRHKRMRFDVWDGESMVISNADRHEVLGFLAELILSVMKSIEPADQDEEEGANDAAR